MAALSSARGATTRKAGNPLPSVLTYPVKATTQIWQGALVVLNAGYAAPATAAASLTAIGRARHSALGGATDGAVFIDVEPGIFSWDVKGGDAPTQANAGALVYIEDDHTVRLTATSTSAAGVLVGIDPVTSQANVLTGQGLNA